MNVRPVVVVADPATPADDAVAVATWEADRRGVDVRIMPAEQLGAVDAAMLVVAGRPPCVEQLVMTSCCPIAVVPARLDAPADDAPVLLVVDLTTEREVYAFAFAEAAARGTRVLAVRTWRHEQACLDLTHRLCPFTTTFPQVKAETVGVDGRDELLTTLAERAQLIVTGRSAARMLAAAERASCPMVVVPPPRPVHYSWLVGPSVSRGDSG